MENVGEANMENEPETVEETPQLFLPPITVDTAFQPHAADVQAQVMSALTTYAAHVATLTPAARAAALDVESRRIGEQYVTQRSHCAFQRVGGGSCGNPINPSLGQACHQHRAYQSPHSILYPVPVMGRCSNCKATPDAGSQGCTACNHFLCEQCMKAVWEDPALAGEGTTVMMYCLRCVVTDTPRVSFLINLHSDGPYSVIFMDPNAESYDVDLRAILGRASAQAKTILTGDLKESPAPPLGPSPRPSPAARPPPAPTGGPRTSQEHQQTLLDTMARVLDGAAHGGYTAGDTYTTPAARPPPPGGAAGLGEAAGQFVSLHVAPPAARFVVPQAPLGGGLQFGPQGQPMGPQPSHHPAVAAASAGAAEAAAALQGAAPGLFTTDQMAQLVGQVTQALQRSSLIDNQAAAARLHFMTNSATSTLGGSRGLPTGGHNMLDTAATTGFSLGERRFFTFADSIGLTESGDILNVMDPLGLGEAAMQRAYNTQHYGVSRLDQSGRERLLPGHLAMITTSESGPGTFTKGEKTARTVPPQSAVFEHMEVTTTQVKLLLKRGLGAFSVDSPLYDSTLQSCYVFQGVIAALKEVMLSAATSGNEWAVCYTVAVMVYSRFFLPQHLTLQTNFALGLAGVGAGSPSETSVLARQWHLQFNDATLLPQAVLHVQAYQATRKALPLPSPAAHVPPPIKPSPKPKKPIRSAPVDGPCILCGQADCSYTYPDYLCLNPVTRVCGLNGCTKKHARKGKRGEPCV